MVDLASPLFLLCDGRVHRMKAQFSLIDLLSVFAISSLMAAENTAPLPNGIKAVWDFEKAYRETTPTTERVCLNGLWKWQPTDPASGDQVPEPHWGWFKVPGAWPGITDYIQKDSQSLIRHRDWNDKDLRDVTAAWQEREFFVPIRWAGRRIVVQTEYLNSFATVFVDGKESGHMRFPAGEVDVTALCEPGRKHTLTMLVVAMPLKAVLQSYTDSASARTVKGSVARRGTCGDVFLVATTRGPRITNVQARPSVLKAEMDFDFTLTNPTARKLTVRARAKSADGNSFDVSINLPVDETNGFIGTSWSPKNWDIHTPQNMCEGVLSLLDENGRVIDETLPIKFGFREFWIADRDFYFNGSRIFLSAVPLDNAEVGAAWATYSAARESLERLKSFGINFVYTHNYGCEPGSHLSFNEVLKAADDVGMLVALSQPHFSHYNWKSIDADKTNGYAEHARFYASVAKNHPSVVLYSMSHNATGYSEDMNPFMIDGLNNPRDQWAERNSKLALRAEAIVHDLDPTRIVYHHASGNLGSMHDMNFYPNFVPIQELSDWFGHWSTNGVKPAFMCEYGAPFTWDWTMYRGWYKGEREFGSAKVPWEYCIAEWNAQFFGDAAYRISEAEKTNLRWEAKQFRAGAAWHRWDYPVQVGSRRFDECYPVFAQYLTDNWRAFRGWGVSGISPWEHEHFWKLRDGANRARREFKTDWENLQRPGYSPDYIADRYERMDMAFERSDWIPTPAAQALLRNNMPLLAFIAGKPTAFTAKDHNYFAGDVVDKQFVVINNSRAPVTAACEWSFSAPTSMSGNTDSDGKIETGNQVRLPIRFQLPRDLPPGTYILNTSVQFSNGETQTDAMKVHVLSQSQSPSAKSKIALFDPKAETARWLQEKQLRFELVDATSELTGFDALIVGKGALTLTNASPNISRVTNGLKVLMFEQTGEVLEKRFGFRVEEYGLRNVFARVPDHPILQGLDSENLRDWRGSSTLLPPQLQHEMRPRYGPTIEWCDIPVTRVWRCGNRGNVASSLIEKPACGDFLPILDGGYSLQYSPLLEYHEGAGLVIFCQLDLTARTEPDPAAELIGNSLLRYLSDWKPSPKRAVTYAGEPAGQTFLESAGISVSTFDSAKLDQNEVLIVGPNAGEVLAQQKEKIAIFTKSGGKLLLIGLEESAANQFLPTQINTRNNEHISSHFESPHYGSFAAGISCADVHNRDPRQLPLITGGAEILGDGILAQANGSITFCQFVPWQFDGDQSNLRRTRRHASVLLSRLLASMGVESKTPILARFSAPVDESKKEQRWRDGLYLDLPQEWDDPYRFFRW
jgi:beta-galactosidase